MNVEINIGRNEFNKLFNACPIVRYTRNTIVYAVYIRKTPPSTIDAYKVFSGKIQHFNDATLLHF